MRPGGAGRAVRGPPGPELLHEVERDAEHHDAGDDDAAGDVARERGDRRRREQQEDERVAEAGEELQHHRPFAVRAQDVGAVFGLAPAGFGLVEARDRASEFGQ